MQPGGYRRELDATLRAAYGEGLLSQGTFLHRINELLSTRLINPEGLVGDLSVRGSEATLAARIARLRTRVRALFASRNEVQDRPMLVLDWSGMIETLSLGRSPGCDVVVAHPTVSRLHARLRYRDGAWVLQDLKSKNGTQINGRTVIRSQLRPGDVVTVGDQDLQID